MQASPAVVASALSLSRQPSAPSTEGGGARQGGGEGEGEGEGKSEGQIGGKSMSIPKSIRTRKSWSRRVGIITAGLFFVFS